MKRLFACAMIGVMACFALAGCTGGSGSSASSASPAAASSDSAAVSSEAASSDGSASSAAEHMTGGWTVPESMGESALTDDESETFEKAISAQADADLEPIAVLATQVVAGQNLAYLCRDNSAAPDEAAQWDIVVVYSDPQHKASISSVASIDLANIESVDKADRGEAVGAWEVKEASSGVAMTAEAAQAFSKAIKDYKGDEINPLALLGTQVVAGTNYLILGTSNTKGQGSDSAVYIATVYEDLDGNAELSDVSQLDLLAYVG